MSNDVFSPEKLAQFIFSKDPNELCSQELILCPDDNDDVDAIITFEILITIYMEGIMMMSSVETISNNSISINQLSFLSPWFNSIGYHLFLAEDSFDNYKEMDKKHFCNIILATDPATNLYFKMNNTHKKYKFVRNGSFDEDEDHQLEDIYSIYIDYTNDKVYYIRFKKIELIKHVQ